MIGIIDYKAGNSPSVLNAFQKLGCEARLVRTQAEISASDGIVLPGVGSADATMRSLKEMDCIDLLSELVLTKKRPFLGICVGLQVLFEYSEEGDVECLGFLPGRIARFRSEGFRVPQMGWNRVDFVRESPLTRGIRQGFFYFVNSYYAQPSDPDTVLGVTDYGGSFCSVAERGNLFGAQCHLEKSGRTGLLLLQNFADLTIGGKTIC